MRVLAALTSVLAWGVSLAEAKTVFAHFMASQFPFQFNIEV